MFSKMPQEVTCLTIQEQKRSSSNLNRRRKMFSRTSRCVFSHVVERTSLRSISKVFPTEDSILHGHGSRTEDTSGKGPGRTPTYSTPPMTTKAARPAGSRPPPSSCGPLILRGRDLRGGSGADRRVGRWVLRQGRVRMIGAGGCLDRCGQQINL